MIIETGRARDLVVKYFGWVIGMNKDFLKKMAELDDTVQGGRSPRFRGRTQSRIRGDKKDD